MLRLLIINVLILSFGYLFSQDNIDYNHKSLFKALQKFNESEKVELEEINVPDSINDNFRIDGKFFTIKDNTEAGIIDYVYIGRVKSCRAGGCNITRPESANEDQEYFDYFILFDQEQIVRLVRVYNYQATHGQEVTSRGWLRQFVGYVEGDDLRVGKEVDAISGATISVYGITHDVEEKSKILRKLFLFYQ